MKVVTVAVLGAPRPIEQLWFPGGRLSQAANIELAMPHTHWPQRLVPNMSADIRGHEALHHHHHDGFAAANLLVWQLHESDVRLETDTFCSCKPRFK